MVCPSRIHLAPTSAISLSLHAGSPHASQATTNRIRAAPLQVLSRPVGPSYSTWVCPPPKRHWRRSHRRSVKGESPKAQPPLMGGVSCWGGGIAEPSWPWAGGTIAGLNRDCSYELACSPSLCQSSTISLSPARSLPLPLCLCLSYPALTSSLVLPKAFFSIRWPSR